MTGNSKQWCRDNNRYRDSVGEKKHWLQKVTQIGNNMVQ